MKITLEGDEEQNRKRRRTNNGAISSAHNAHPGTVPITTTSVSLAALSMLSNTTVGQVHRNSMQSISGKDYSFLCSSPADTGADVPSKSSSKTSNKIVQASRGTRTIATTQAEEQQQQNDYEEESMLHDGGESINLVDTCGTSIPSSSSSGHTLQLSPLASMPSGCTANDYAKTVEFVKAHWTQHQQEISLLDVYLMWRQCSRKKALTSKCIQEFYNKEGKRAMLMNDIKKWTGEERQTSIGDVFHYSMPMGTYGMGIKGRPLFVVRLGELKPDELVRKLSQSQLRRGYTHKILQALHGASLSTTRRHSSVHVVIDCCGVSTKKDMKKRLDFLRTLHDTALMKTPYYAASDSVTYVNVPPSTIMKLAMSRRRGHGRSVASNTMYEHVNQNILTTRHRPTPAAYLFSLGICHMKELPSFLDGTSNTPWPYGRAGPSRISIVPQSSSSSSLSNISASSSMVIPFESRASDMISAMSISDSDSDDNDSEGRRSIDLSSLPRSANLKVVQTEAMPPPPPPLVPGVPVPIKHVLDPSNQVLDANPLAKQLSSAVASSTSASTLAAIFPSDSLALKNTLPADPTLPTAQSARLQSYRVTAGHMAINYVFDPSGEIRSFHISH